MKTTNITSSWITNALKLELTSFVMLCKSLQDNPTNNLFFDNNFPSGGKQTTSTLEDISEHSQQKLNWKALGIDRARGPIVQILPNLNKRLDSTPHSVGKEARLEKLEYVAKGEPKGKPTFRMPILEEMMRKEIKEFDAYVNIWQSTHMHNLKKDAVPRRSRTITSTDNLLEDPDQALDYAKLLLLNLKKQSKESKKQRIQEEIKKALGEGSGAAPDSLDHSDSSDNSIWNSTDDDKTESDKDSDNRDDNDVSDNEDENEDSDDADNVNNFDKDSNVENDQTADFVIRPHVKEPVQEQLEPQPHSPSVTITSHEDVRSVVKEFKNQVLKLLPKADSDFVQHRLEGTILDVINKNLVNLFQSNSTITADPTEYELKLQLYEKMFKTATYLKHEKHHALYDTLQESIVEDAKEPRQVEEQEHEAQSDVLEEELEEHKLQNGSVVMFGKCMNKFLNKDKITKEDLEGPAFELLKNRFKNSGKLAYNLEQYHIALTDKID
ncbi:hypothetical protein Tco_0693533 [Tanacetum coccineum]